MRRTATLTALAATVLLAGCGGGGDEGYKDPARLAARLKATAQRTMDKKPDVYDHARVTAAKCVTTETDRVLKCSGEISTGDRWTMTVTVSEDGKSYVTETTGA
jgi:hypothetical protein